MTATIRKSIGIATTVTALVLSGTGAASALAAHHHTGKEYFLLAVANSTATADNETVIAHGAFTGGGKDDASHDNYDILHLGGGVLRINHPDAQSHFSDTINAKTCFITFTITGKYTLGSGTGRFKGITGHGSYKVSEQGILPRTKKGACNQDAEPLATAGVINASGPVYWG